MPLAVERGTGLLRRQMQMLILEVVLVSNQEKGVFRRGGFLQTDTPLLTVAL